MGRSNSIINKLIFSGYKVIYAALIALILNDFRIINVNEDFQGFIADAGDEAYEFVVANRFFPQASDQDIQIVLVDEDSVGNFPQFMIRNDKGDKTPNKKLNAAYLEALRTGEPVKYSETKTISPKKAKRLYCETLHRGEVSKSRKPIVDAVNRILEDKPKAIVIDILLGGKSAFCPEYDDDLENIIKNHNNIFTVAGINPKDSNTSEIEQSIDQYLHTAIKKQDRAKTTLSEKLEYPFFKQTYKNDPKLNTIGVGGGIVDSSVITQAQLWMESDRYLIPALATVVAQSGCCSKENIDLSQRPFIKNINWREGRPGHQNINAVIMGSPTLPSYKDKIVFFGTNLPGHSQDRLHVPTEDDAIPGVYVQANILDNIINSDFIDRNPEWVSVCLTILIVTLLFFAFDSQTILPHACNYNSLYRKISVSLHRLFHFDIGEADFFLFIEIGAILFSLAVLELFNYYIDMSGPVLGGIASFSFFSIYNYFSNKYLFEKQSVLKEYIDSDKYKRVYLLEVRFEDLSIKDKLGNDVESILFDRLPQKYGVIVGELTPFNDDDVFGSTFTSNYYWWVSPEGVAIPEDQDVKNDLKESIPDEFENNIEVFWSYQDLDKNTDVRLLLDDVIGSKGSTNRLL